MDLCNDDEQRPPSSSAREQFVARSGAFLLSAAVDGGYGYGSMSHPSTSLGLVSSHIFDRTSPPRRHQFAHQQLGVGNGGISPTTSGAMKQQRGVAGVQRRRSTSNVFPPRTTITTVRRLRRCVFTHLNSPSILGIPRFNTHPSTTITLNLIIRAFRIRIAIFPVSATTTIHIFCPVSSTRIIFYLILTATIPSTRRTIIPPATRATLPPASAVRSFTHIFRPIRFFRRAFALQPTIATLG